MASRRKTHRAAKSSPEMPRLGKAAGAQRVLDARPDTPDFRDRLYEPTLVEVPLYRTLEDYQRSGVPILDQGQEGACTGFGLATVANYLLRCRRVVPENANVSPRMFYEMARRYDEWPGEDYSGSSARGAMKGWHKHGVCTEAVWPYRPNSAGDFTTVRAADAALRPLGAYYRVNHLDLVSMHSAISEVGILYATSRVHAGWQSPDTDGTITRDPTIIGGHAFAIVGYDQQGLWIQNSWGPSWGRDGFGHISYDDWLANGTDVWVARLGAPISLPTAEATARGASGISSLAEAYTSAQLQPHIISLGNDGQLERTGTYAKTPDEVAAMFTRDFVNLTAGWARKRLLLYAHGGLVDEATAVQHVADYREALLASEVYPLAFVWHTDFWSTLGNILEDVLSRRRPEGLLEAAKDFMLDRLDDLLEPVARTIDGKAQWDEMKENGTLATTSSTGGARIAARALAQLLQADPSVEIHLAGHSAGSIFMAPLLQLLTGDRKKKIASGPLAGQTGLGLKVATCTLWAPACTLDLFNEVYVPALTSGAIGRFALFTLTPQAEEDDNCAHVYNKSLLYLVSNAFEQKPRIPLFRDGWPILGMEKFIDNGNFKALRRKYKDRILWVHSPNSSSIGSGSAARSTSHGGFDDDEATLKSTLAFITK